MPNRFLTSRLAAKGAVGQVDAIVAANRTNAQVDRAIVALWNRLIRFLAKPIRPSPQEAYNETFRIISQIEPEARRTLTKAIERQALDGHRDAVRDVMDTLPVKYVQAMALQESRGGTQELKPSLYSHLFEDRSTSQLPGIISIGTTQRGTLKARDVAKKFRKPLTAAQTKKAYEQLLFKPPSRAEVDAVMYAPMGGKTWEQRMKDSTRLAQPQTIAQIVANGVSQGMNHKEIAKIIRPAVQGVKTTANRLARTYGIYVRHEMQMKTWEQLGDLSVGYQVHGMMDQNIRPAHALRNGTTYYKNPAAGQKGLNEMPHPPLEADGSPAWNCRCRLSPVLAAMPHIVQDPSRMAVFETAADKLIPDPAVYSTWFKNADEHRRRIAVGTRRYSAVKELLGGKEPTWEHFVNPDTGELLKVTQIQAEPIHERAARIANVQRTIQERQRLIERISTYGFEPPERGQTVPQVAVQPKPLPQQSAAQVTQKKPPINIASPVSEPFKNRIEMAMNQFPDHVHKLTEYFGVVVHIGELVTDIDPLLKGVHPRGWSMGTWDNADGFYDGSTFFHKTVGVSEKYKPIGSDAVAISPRSKGVFRHEYSHGIDHALGHFSHSKEFQDEYNKDVANLPKDLHAKLAYFLQSGMAGPEETFAEVCADIHGGGGSAELEVGKRFPNVKALIERKLASLK